MACAIFWFVCLKFLFLFVFVFPLISSWPKWCGSQSLGKNNESLFYTMNDEKEDNKISTTSPRFSGFQYGSHEVRRLFFLSYLASVGGLGVFPCSGVGDLMSDSDLTVIGDVEAKK